MSDTDTAQVLVIEPGISITKTASPAAVLAGRNVTYTFEVTNTGDVGLTGVVPVDDKCAPLVRTGGDDGNDILDGANSGEPETWTYTCTRAGRAARAAGDHRRQHGRPSAGWTRWATPMRTRRPAEVAVIAPAINLEKSVSDDLVLSGSTSWTTPSR